MRLESSNPKLFHQFAQVLISLVDGTWRPCGKQNCDQKEKEKKKLHKNIKAGLSLKKRGGGILRDPIEYDVLTHSKISIHSNEQLLLLVLKKWIKMVLRIEQAGIRNGLYVSSSNGK